MGTMHGSFLSILLWLLAGVVLIVICTTRFRVHAFFALILASFVVGLGVHIPVTDLITVIKNGFGNIMASLGLIIVLGTTLGVLLEFTGCTQVMANYILKKVGERRAPLAMSITGFIVGLPIFCDSGYVVLSGLNQSLARRTGIPVAVMSVSLATGLYSVHCLVPPHPGAAAAAGIIGVDFGKLIIAGIGVAIPAAAVGYLWAGYMGKRYPSPVNDTAGENAAGPRPGVIQAFLPVAIPILLIAMRSFIAVEHLDKASWTGVILSLGDPVIALSVGIVLAMTSYSSWNKNIFGTLLEDATYKAGGILVIIGAGGAFGAVLAATRIGEHLGGALPLAGLGIFVPFLIASILKTAQGSSTVAIITTASIVQPLLSLLGLDSATGHLLCVLSMGAGSMMISHANDAYFWVIAKFSGQEMKPVLTVYSVATLLMGLTSLLMVFILQKIIG
jgi:GntP family gluconate:H+ symporter